MVFKIKKKLFVEFWEFNSKVSILSSFKTLLYSIQNPNLLITVPKINVKHKTKYA